jgi:UDP-N-acetylmuramate dehydrogenase
MQLLTNVSLKPHNTFGIDVLAKKLTSFSTLDEAKEIIASKEFTSENNQLILGGGSNVLFTKNFDGIIALNQLKGIDLVNEDAEYFYVKAAAGEVWHELVLNCIANHWAGLENLSLIPGNVGASPMQNIGAYGVEIKDVFHSLDALNIHTGEVITFHNSDCEFGYRESVFKRKYKNQFIIVSVTYRLLKTPQLNTSYGAIEQELEKMNISTPTMRDVSNAVIAIRSSKLPNPKEIGNAGSFFKNPVVSAEKLEQLKHEFPNIPNYPQANGDAKLAAGWLIEQTGWKGKTIDNRYGVHKLQALVLVNYGGATGNEVYQLSTDIVNSVKEKFGVELEREVNIY